MIYNEILQLAPIYIQKICLLRKILFLSSDKQPKMKARSAYLSFLLTKRGLMKDNKYCIWSWALYDWANSAFATTVMAGFFPLFFKTFWADPKFPQTSTFYLGMANSFASIIVAIIAPFLGAIADKGSMKKKFLIFFAFMGAITTGALWFLKMDL